MAQESDCAVLPDQEAAAERQFAGRAGQGLLGYGLGAAGQLDYHVAWLDDGHPFLRGAFTLTHTGFQRFLANRLVRENPDPDLSTALHVPCGGDTGSFNLLASHPATLKDLQTIFTEIQFVISSRDSPAAPSLNLSMFYAFGH